jgi:hypothetical protein
MMSESFRGGATSTSKSAFFTTEARREEEDTEKIMFIRKAGNEFILSVWAF